MSFTDRLAQLDNVYEDAEAMQGGQHPEGKYTGKIVTARIEESTKPGNDTLSLNVHVKTEAGMAFINLTLTNFTSEKALSFTKGQLLNLGFEDKFSNIESYLPSLIGASLEIDVKHEEGDDITFVNVFARKLVSELGSVGFQNQFSSPDMPEPAGFAAAPVGSNLPFS